MKTVTGQGRKIVQFDSGYHGQTIEQVAYSYAPAATIDYRKRGNGADINFEQIRDEIREIARNPEGIDVVQFSWGLPGWISEENPPWVADPKNDGSGELRGLGEWFKLMSEAGIVIVAAAGDDRQGLIGCNYPACDPYVLPAMGYAKICNRTHRGFICPQADSASLAASVLAASICLVKEAISKDGGPSVFDVLTALNVAAKIDGEGFNVLDLDGALNLCGATRDAQVRMIKPFADRKTEYGELLWPGEVDVYQWTPMATGKMSITCSKPFKLTRVYDTIAPRPRIGALSTEVKKGKPVRLTVTGGEGAYNLKFKRV